MGELLTQKGSVLSSMGRPNGIAFIEKGLRLIRAAKNERSDGNKEMWNWNQSENASDDHLTMNPRMNWGKMGTWSILMMRLIGLT